MRRASLLFLFLATALSGSAWANEQEDLEKLRKRISVLQQQLEQASESKSEAADDLRDSERAISNSNRTLRELSRKQQQTSQALVLLEQQSTKVREDMQAMQTRLSALLYRQYLNGQQEYLPLLLGNNEPNQAARDMQYFGYVARAQAAWLASMRASLARLDELSRQTRDKRAELASVQQEAASQQRELQKERQARRKVLSRIQVKIRQQRREIGRLHRNELRLTHLIESIGEMGEQSNSGSFLALRGKLIMPVKGRVTNRFGAQRQDSNTPWKGWFVRSEAGQPVKAVASGKVVFADWLRGFGNLLIIDHGKGYMSLYAYNETLYKQVGDNVDGGDTIATAGSSGGNEDSGLYFELRHAGEPMDPAKWIAQR